MRQSVLWLAVVTGSGAGCAGADEVEPLVLPSTSSHSTDPPTVTSDTETPSSSTDTYTDTGSGQSSTGLHGSVPAVALAVPTFGEVLAMDGTARSSADLVGQPSVVWFYPAAFTGG